MHWKHRRQASASVAHSIPLPLPLPPPGEVETCFYYVIKLPWNTTNFHKRRAWQNILQSLYAWSPPGNASRLFRRVSLRPRSSERDLHANNKIHRGVDTWSMALITIDRRGDKTAPRRWLSPEFRRGRRTVNSIISSSTNCLIAELKIERTGITRKRLFRSLAITVPLNLSFLITRNKMEITICQIQITVACCLNGITSKLHMEYLCETVQTSF